MSSYLNLLDIEIARFMQNVKLAVHFSERSDASAFVFDFFKNNAREQLSPKAYGRLLQDLNTKNLKAFTKSYNAAEKVIKSALMMRYLVTTLSEEERLNSLVSKLRLSHIQVNIDIVEPADIAGKLTKYRLGVVYFYKMSNGTLQMEYSLPAPALFHIVYDTVSAWGYTGNYEPFERGKLSHVNLSISDSLSEHKEMIALGKVETNRSHPSLIACS